MWSSRRGRPFIVLGPILIQESTTIEGPFMAFSRCAAMASEAFRSGPSARCAYRWVVAAWVWPSSLPIIGRRSPLLAPTLANECRSSWSRRPWRRASLRIESQGFDRLTRCDRSPRPGSTHGKPLRSSWRATAQNVCEPSDTPRLCSPCVAKRLDIGGSQWISVEPGTDGLKQGDDPEEDHPAEGPGSLCSCDVSHGYERYPPWAPGEVPGLARAHAAE